MAKKKTILLNEGMTFRNRAGNIVYMIRKITGDGIWIVWSGVEIGNFYTEHEAIGYFEDGTWVLINQ
jgi:hypothetical protein